MPVVAYAGNASSMQSSYGLRPDKSSLGGSYPHGFYGVDYGAVHEAEQGSGGKSFNESRRRQ